jgi:hypothetical protein
VPAAAGLLLAACSHGVAPDRLAGAPAAAVSNVPATDPARTPAPPRAAAPLVSAPVTAYTSAPTVPSTAPRPTPVATGPVLPPGEVALPSWPGDANAAMLVHDASFVGNPASGCVWLVAGGNRIPALWPPGYRARFDPLRIYDEHDREVWRTGQLTDVGGGGAGHPELVPPACRDGQRVFWLWPLKPPAGG